MSLTIEPLWKNLIDDTTRRPLDTIAPIHGDSALLTLQNRRYGLLWILENRRFQDAFRPAPVDDVIMKEGYVAATNVLTTLLPEADADLLSNLVHEIAHHCNLGEDETAIATLLQPDLGIEPFGAHHVITAMLLASGYRSPDLAI